MEYVTIIGVVGATMILLAFMMIQLKKWKDDFLIYDLFNLAGSLLLIAYAAALKSYPFIILNLVWAIISLRDTILDLRQKTNSRKKKKRTLKSKTKLMHKTKG